MEILGKFGFDLKLFVGQIVNFLILFVIFKKFLYVPLMNAMRERQARIKEGLENAEKTKKILEETRKDRENVLKRTGLEATEIIENSKRAAEQLRQEMEKKSRVESEKIVLQAKNEAQAEMMRMEKDLKGMSLDLSQKILENLVKTLFTEEEKERILKKALEKLKENPER
ncbi:MAG: F0F1 ATP synthase subunit B [Endomicrobiales bacterium]|nr:F0F1 ATP synthase subunit B [Endomicrobiales bacterium]